MPEVFEEIVREYQDKIFRLAYAILEDRAAAEEATQDALVRIWKGLPRFRGDSSLSTWIYAITRNTCLTTLARRGPRMESIEEPGTLRAAEKLSQPDWFAPAAPDPVALLSGLPAKYRQVVALFYMQEKSYDEVASMLNLPVGTIKTYLFRARQSLAQQVARGRVSKGEA